MNQTPCPHCRTTIRHGERIGCCSGCSRVFSSTTAHDKHQRIIDGRGVCLNPATLTRSDGTPVLVARPHRQQPDVLMWGEPGTWKPEDSR